LSENRHAGLDSEALGLVTVNSASRRLAVTGYVVAVFCLIWVFHDVHPERLWHQIRNIRWAWVLLAIGIDVSAYAFQGLRWQMLLRPLGRTTVLKATERIYAGLFLNEVSPLRAGEALRVFLMARDLTVSVPAVISTVAIERFFDGIWLAINIGLVSLYLPLPRIMHRAADILGMVLIMAVMLLVLVLRRSGTRTRPMNSAPSTFWGRVLSAWHTFRTALHQVSFSKSFMVAFFVSSLVVLSQALAFWLLMYACDLHFSLWVGLAVFTIVQLGTAIPSAPANVGAYQFLTVLGLTLFGAEKTIATSFSIVAFVVLTIPLLLIGFAAILRMGLNLRSLRNELMA
jgi:glycosyltransferase 2 family protein